MNEFGLRLRDLRKAQDMKQAELAEKIGYCPSVISLLELGKRRPNRPTVLKLASVLGTTPKYLLGHNGDDARNHNLSLGTYLYRLRLESGLSTSELANQLRVCRASVSAWENNKTKPSDESCVLLANIFNIDVDSIKALRNDSLYNDHRSEDHMGMISKFNHEGYYDPTAYEALNNVDKALRAAQRERIQRLYKPYRPIIYVCSPYAGNVEKNVSAAQKYCKYVVGRDCIPIALHLFFPQFLNDNNPDDRELAAMMSLTLLKKCSEIWVFGDNITPGMQREIRRAKKNEMIMRFFTTDCQEVTE